MKVDYNIIFESYQRANEEFLNDCMEIVTEAETLNTTTPAAQNNAAPNSTENQVNGKTSQSIDTTRNNQLEPSSKKKQSLIQRIQQIIQKVIAKVQEASIKIMNRLKLMLESDKGFFNTLHQRRAAQKPLQNFKAITYTYDEKYLDTTINGIQKLALGSINQLNNFTGSTSDPKIKQILESDQNAVSNVLLSFFTKEKVEGGPDVQAFTREMIDRFRGEKKEAMHSQTEIPMLMIQAKSTSELSAKCNDIIRQCKNSVNTLKAIEMKARIQNTSEGLLEISRRVNKAVNIYNTLLTLTRMYFELKLEQSLSARMLLKKFYTF